MRSRFGATRQCPAVCAVGFESMIRPLVGPLGSPRVNRAKAVVHGGTAAFVHGELRGCSAVKGWGGLLRAVLYRRTPMGVVRVW